MADWLIGLPIPFIVASVTLLIRAEGRSPRDVRQVKVWKSLATVLVIGVCLASFARPAEMRDAGYTLLILAGLLLSLAGDVALIFQEDPHAFIAGLIAFLLAHLAYIAAFVHLQSTLTPSDRPVPEVLAGITLAIVALVVYGFMRPGLGSMQAPVILYMLVISTMVHRAVAVSLAYPGAPIKPALMLGGAFLFYLSDAILGVDKFRFNRRLPHGHLWNLTAYYAGQVLLALSVSFN